MHDEAAEVLELEESWARARWTVAIGVFLIVFMSAAGFAAGTVSRLTMPVIFDIIGALVAVVVIDLLAPAALYVVTRRYRLVPPVLAIWLYSLPAALLIGALFGVACAVFALTWELPIVLGCVLALSFFVWYLFRKIFLNPFWIA